MKRKEAGIGSDILRTPSRKIESKKRQLPVMGNWRDKNTYYSADLATLDQLVKYPQFFHMPLVNGSYWAMVHGSNAEQVLQDAEGCAVMQELGRNMAWLLHCIEAGRAAGFEHPQNPKRPMTNFIR